MDVKDALASEAALASFAEEFLSCRLPAAAWTHAAHIMVAAWYLVTLPEEEALERMRTGIPRFNLAHGGANTADAGYHETLTRFWVFKIAAFLHRRAVDEPALEKVRAAVEHFAGRRDWFADHYSFDVVKSRQARAEWMKPDLRPID